LKKDRKYNDQQNTTHKTIDGATRSPLKTGVNTDARKGSAVPAALVGSSASYKMTHIVPVSVESLRITVYIIFKEMFQLT
jgi:hypothetical protein